MKELEILNNIPKEGFIKVQRPASPKIPAATKSALIRKGNELYNNGKIDQAKRIFLTTGYSDGLIRLGDYYSKKNDSLEALRMYWLAPAPDKVNAIIEKMVMIIQKWLHEEESTK
ncbi:MAG: hypothetical protein ACLFR1_11420 [Spirochaetia bacterium]